MWKRLRSLLTDLRRWWRKGRDEPQVLDARARFWSEVRAGEREAEAKKGS
jgi:hypothetical protein